MSFSVDAGLLQRYPFVEPHAAQPPDVRRHRPLLVKYRFVMDSATFGGWRRGARHPDAATTVRKTRVR